MFRQAPLGRIKDDVLLMDPARSGTDGTRAELLQNATKCLYIVDFQLDFRLTCHAVLSFGATGFFLLAF